MTLSRFPVDIVLARLVYCSVTNGRKTCPLCCVAIDTSNLNPNIAVKALISKIKVCCRNNGCSWTGQHTIGNHQHSALDKHLAACPYEKCPACSAEWEFRDFVATLMCRTVHKDLCYVRFGVERDYQGKFNCTLEASAFSLLKARGVIKVGIKCLVNKLLSDQTSGFGSNI